MANFNLDPLRYQSEVLHKGLNYERPPVTIDTTKHWFDLRKQPGGISKWAFLPKRLTAQQKFLDLSAKVFGKKFPSPIALAPVGV
ncbi:hypothetical protein BDZ45DRAFT_741714 [Acephala macrosclerotiorum]|nr:hypothetical protein BDZ45DRAFT_741714 [Acephala macrosclerotiorum]